MKTLSLICTFMFGIMFVVIVAASTLEVRQLRVENSELRTALVVANEYIPNILEVQQRLKTEGYYEGDIDGKWGEQTEAAWCNWTASRYFKE